MALDLNDPKAIDYSSKTPLFPFTAYGSFTLALLSYIESGPAGSETNKGDKEFDLALARVEESSDPSIRPGDVYGFFFQTGGDGMTVKSRPYKAAALRDFHKGVLGIDPRDRSFDANAARTAMLAEDLSAGENKVRLKTSKGNEIEGKPGESYRNDVWSAA